MMKRGSTQSPCGSERWGFGLVGLLINAAAFAQETARPFAAPPGLSPERVKVLRDAFDATMKDPAFLADMARQKLEVRPVPGTKLDELVREVYSYPADVVKIAADSIKIPPR